MDIQNPIPFKAHGWKGSTLAIRWLNAYSDEADNDSELMAIAIGAKCRWSES